MMQTAMLAVAAFMPSPAHRPSLAAGGGRGATAPCMRLPASVQDVVDKRFQKEYPPKELDALWSVLKKAYGTEADALRAVTQNPTILNPLYTNPPEIVTRSKEALVEVMGEEEALEVMLKNPAILQCGSLLAKQPAGQIKSFANVRQAADSLPDEAPIYFLGTALALFAFAVIGKNGGLPEEADGLVRGVGILLAVGGICATAAAAILQNVGETGRPSKKK